MPFIFHTPTKLSRGHEYHNDDIAKLRERPKCEVLFPIVDAIVYAISGVRAIVVPKCYRGVLSSSGPPEGR
jgi:hypothetical protein